MHRQISSYAEFFKRPADAVLEPVPGPPSVSVARFPPSTTGLFGRLRTPVPDRWVYMTCGMSEQPMQIPSAEADVYPTRIELLAYTVGAYVGAEDGQDMVSGCLQALALLPFQNDLFFGPTHTVALPEPLAPNSEMTAFFFAVPDGVDMARLCACTPAAQLVVSVMPITSSERAYAMERTPVRLIELFEKNRVPNYFDPFRTAVV